MSGLSSVYPPPPWYYKHFTEANLQKLKEEKAKNDSKTGDEQIELPHPLSLLVPPKLPTQQGYRSFGSLWQSDDKLLPLSEANIPQLYGQLDSASGDDGDVKGSHQDRIWELKKLLKSLLVNFLELTGIMSTRPEEFPSKIEDIRVILINMHHLLNEYRPHQSRESLLLTMEEQIAHKQSEVETLRRVCDEVRAKISALAEQAAGVDSSLDSSELQDRAGNTDTSKQRDLLAWRALDDI